MAEQFDPYRKWLGIPSQVQPPNHYQLLGIPALENDPDVIENAANRQMAHVRTFQTGKHSKVSQQILNELSAAKRCLLISEKKADYDAKLKDQLTPASTSAPVGQAALPPSPAVQQSPPPPSEPTSDSVQVRSRRSSAARRHRRKQRKSSAIPMLLGIIALAVLAGVAILVAHHQKTKTTQQNKSAQEQTTQLVSPRTTIETSMVPTA
ncbi:MAG TPA: hypothetical protein EYN70_10850 [Planctomycetaceae bacterium]|nr:hypothetical protein [Planctomycetaceae bacterium]